MAKAGYGNLSPSPGRSDKKNKDVVDLAQDYIENTQANDR